MLAGINPLMMTPVGGGGSGVGAVFDIRLATAAGLDALSTTGWDLLIGKSRVNATDWVWRDSSRGFGNKLASNTAAAQGTFGSYASDMGSGNGALFRFKKATKVVDIVPYTGNGSNRTIPHNLGSVPGMVIIKSLSSGTASWIIQHRSIPSTDAIFLDLTNAAFTNPAYFNSAYATSSVFSVGTSGSVNANGQNYIAYLLPHDTDPAGFIQTSSFTTDGSGNGSFATSWAEGAQFAMIKAVTTTGDWEILDSARTPGFSGNDARIRANLPDAEDSVTRASQSAGTLSFTGLSASQTYIGLFVRAP